MPDQGFGLADEPPDMTNQYNTALSPQDEAAYQAWGKQQAATPERNGRNPASDTYDYDMRGFWKSGMKFAGNGHGGDLYKKPNHPTFSNQSQYSGRDGYKGGTWSGGQDGAPWGFTPSQTNLNNTGVAGLERYFGDAEPGNYLMLPKQERHFGGTIRRDDGGSIPTGQITQTQDPRTQALYQRFAAMSPEQLQEAAVRMGPGSQVGRVAQQVLQQKHVMSQQAAAPQQTEDSGFGGAQGFASGGMPMSASEGSPWWTRSEARGMDSGFLHTAGPGRTDNIPIHPVADSYVLPADVVSGLGSGNSLAGAHAIELALATGPHGIPLQKGPSGYHGPRAPTPYREATGGTVPRVPIIAAGGEYIISAKQVAAIGGGDVKKGHSILDKFVLHIRKRTIEEMKKLKGPVGAKK